MTKSKTNNSVNQGTIQALRDELRARFPERNEVIDGSLCAVLAGEHVLLLGPPGTAKSALVRAIAQAFSGRYFEWLLTKFSTPEELFGPVSLAGLEHDRYERITAGKLPEAEMGFVDEVFRANSAILNSLLTLVNERVYHNGTKVVRCPLVSLFGAANDLPDGKELEALFDRFLLRFDVQYLLQAQNFRSVITSPEPVSSVCLTMDDLRAEQAAVAKVKITDDTVDALIAIRDACRAEGIVASDRRWKKSLRLIQAAAHLAGEAVTTPEDLAMLVDSLWREPKDRPKIARLVGRLADPVGAKAAEILDAAREAAQRAAALRTGERKTYIAQAAAAVEQFNQQQDALTGLAGKAGRRAKQAIADAQAEIRGFHAEMARAVSAGMGLRTLGVA